SDLAAEHEPPQALVRGIPRVREDRDVTRVHGRARGGEQVCGRALRAKNMWLETSVEIRDELRTRRRRTAELRPVVNVEDRDALACRCNRPVDRLDPPRIASGIEVLLCVAA